MRGYVYVLTNPSMPALVKIGSTRLSPYERAATLSSATGVPLPFKVAMYAEFMDCRKAERWVQSRMVGFRVNENREFFKNALHEAACWLYHHPQRLSFAAAPNLHTVLGIKSFDDVLNPWRAVL